MTSPEETLMRVGNVPIYAVDQLVRAAPSLQRTPLADALALSLHPDQAAKLGLSDGDLVDVSQSVVGSGSAAGVQVLVRCDDKIAMGCGRIPAGVPGAERLGPQIGPLAVVLATSDQPQGETA
jgi:NADH-quinone oxidoreductase subunit G